MAKRKDGTILVGSHRGINVFDPATGALFARTRIGKDLPGNRGNDGACDAMGRFWFGSMMNNVGDLGADLPITADTGVLYRIDADGTATVMERSIGVSNGPCWSPDNRIFYFTDSRNQVIWAYDFNLAEGTIQSPRVQRARTRLSRWRDRRCRGFLWSARWEGSCVLRIDPKGRIDASSRCRAARHQCLLRRRAARHALCHHVAAACPGGGSAPPSAAGRTLLLRPRRQGLRKTCFRRLAKPANYHTINYAMGVAAMNLVQIRDSKGSGASVSSTAAPSCCSRRWPPPSTSRGGAQEWPETGCGRQGPRRQRDRGLCPRAEAETGARAGRSSRSGPLHHHRHRPHPSGFGRRARRHAQELSGAVEELTDSLKMFKMGLEGGKPKSRSEPGVQPDGSTRGRVLAGGPGQPLPRPSFALDGGEEPELAGLYTSTKRAARSASASPWATNTRIMSPSGRTISISPIPSCAIPPSGRKWCWARSPTRSKA